MIIANVRRILREDLERSEKIPAWVDNLIGPINEFLDVATTLLRGNVTFKDNFLCKQVSLEFTHGVSIPVNVGNSRSRVLGIIPLDCIGQALDKWKMNRNDDGSVGITLYFDGGSSTTKATCTIIILFGS